MYVGLYSQIFLFKCMDRKVQGGPEKNNTEVQRSEKAIVVSFFFYMDTL